MAETPRVGIIANTSKEGAKELLIDLVERFAAKSVEVALLEESAQFAELDGGFAIEELAERVDLFVVLGGDGTILWVLRQLKEKVRPIAAINTGTLGFLTCAMESESARLVDAIVSGDYVTTNRVIIEGEYEVDGEVQAEFCGLNEVTLSRGVDSRVVHIEALINESHANRYSGDGLILATPTGSTAYSLSAGGPLIQPGSNVFVITPICSHALANRPLVLDAESTVTFEAPEQRDDLTLMVDGQLVAKVTDVAKVRMRKASFWLPLIFFPEQNFFHTMHQKLGWTGSTLQSTPK